MRIRFISLSLCFAMLLGVFAGCGGSSSASDEVTTPPKVKKPESFADTIARVRSGVVRIEAETCDGEGVGTGFLISRRLVATVEHVVDGATSITLKRGGRVLGTGTVIGEDRGRDLALVRTSRPIRGHIFKLSSQAPRLGEDVAAVGFPLGLPLSVTRGSVSGSGRTIPIDGFKRQKLIQTDAAVSPGNSGGPLLRSDGAAVVGLLDLDATLADGIAFAVSAEVARPLLEAWRVAPQPVSAATCDVYEEPDTYAAPAPEEEEPDASDYATYAGDYFNIFYPSYWDIETSDLDKGGYSDTTIRNPDEPSIMLRVDVTPEASSDDPMIEAQPVVEALRRAPGYQELEYVRTDFGGYAALYWEFLVDEDGGTLHKIDVIFVDEYGRAVAVLTQAPVSAWDQWTASFDEIRSSLTMN